MLFDFQRCLKWFTFWLITSLGKNNYCHMVCGLEFRRIKSLLLPIVLFSHSLPALKKLKVCNRKPNGFATCEHPGLRVDLTPSPTPFKNSAKAAWFSECRWVDGPCPPGAGQARVCDCTAVISLGFHGLIET